MISGIGWVSELIGIAGGHDIFPERARSHATRRMVAERARGGARAPEVIVGRWCGKKFRPERVAARPGWADVPAVRDGELHEIKAADILQPGPAALTDGVRRMHAIFLRLERARVPMTVTVVAIFGVVYLGHGPGRAAVPVARPHRGRAPRRASRCVAIGGSRPTQACGCDRSADARSCSSPSWSSRRSCGWAASTPG